jgi:hypothetical protein
VPSLSRQSKHTMSEHSVSTIRELYNTIIKTLSNNNYSVIQTILLLKLFSNDIFRQNQQHDITCDEIEHLRCSLTEYISNINKNLRYAMLRVLDDNDVFDSIASNHPDFRDAVLPWMP